MKRVFILIILSILCINVSNAGFRAKKFATGKTEFTATKKAYWKLFEKVLTKKVGRLMASGALRNCFKTDQDDDFPAFKDYYFDAVTERCTQLLDGKYKCSVLATIDLLKVKSKIREKALQCNVDSKHLGTYHIAIIRDKSNKGVKRLAKKLQYELEIFGHNITIFDKNTQVGILGNDCQLLKKQLKQVKAKGKNYQNAIDKYKNKVQECKKYKDVAYKLILDEVNIKNATYDKHESKISGTLIYDIALFNTQKGTKDSSLPNEGISSYAYDTSQSSAKVKLANSLYNIAAAKISKGMNELFMDIHSQSTPKANMFNYTAFIHGLTNDRADRKKSRFIRDILKAQYKVIPKKDNRASSDFKIVYKMQVAKEIDLENVIDALYHAADSSTYKNFRAEVDQNSAINIFFGN